MGRPRRVADAVADHPAHIAATHHERATVDVEVEGLPRPIVGSIRGDDVHRHAVDQRFLDGHVLLRGLHLERGEQHRVGARDMGVPAFDVVQRRIRRRRAVSDTR